VRDFLDAAFGHADLDWHGHVVPALLRRFHEGKRDGRSEVTLWGTGTPRRELLHVDDLADAVVFLAERGFDGARVNVGCGGLFVATNFLILRGGETVGPHLGLLGVYLPGYSVSFVGSLIGFVYMFVIGYGMGRILGSVYNRIAHG